jgi:hypothetical protein
MDRKVEHRVLVGGHDLAEAGQVIGPAVRRVHRLAAHHVGIVGGQFQHGAEGADAAGFRGHVAPEPFGRRQRLAAVFLGLREEAFGLGEGVVDQRLAEPVTRHVEEPHGGARLGHLGGDGLAFGVAALREARDVHDRDFVGVDRRGLLVDLFRKVGHDASPVAAGHGLLSIEAGARDS